MLPSFFYIIVKERDLGNAHERHPGPYGDRRQ